MRGGGGAATLAALPTPLGSVLLNAPLSAPAFARPPPRFPVAVAPPPGAPPLRANEAAGMARTMNNASMAQLKRDLGGRQFDPRPYANKNGPAGLRNFLSVAIFSAHATVLSK